MGDQRDSAPAAITASEVMRTFAKIPTGYMSVVGGHYGRPDTDMPSRNGFRSRITDYSAEPFNDHIIESFARLYDVAFDTASDMMVAKTAECVSSLVIHHLATYASSGDDSNAFASEALRVLEFARTDTDDVRNSKKRSLIDIMSSAFYTLKGKEHLDVAAWREALEVSLAKALRDLQHASAPENSIMVSTGRSSSDVFAAYWKDVKKYKSTIRNAIFVEPESFERFFIRSEEYLPALFARANYIVFLTEDPSLRFRRRTWAEEYSNLSKKLRLQTMLKTLIVYCNKARRENALSAVVELRFTKSPIDRALYKVDDNMMVFSGEQNIALERAYRCSRTPDCYGPYEEHDEKIDGYLANSELIWSSDGNGPAGGPDMLTERVDVSYDALVNKLMELYELNSNDMLNRSLRVGEWLDDARRGERRNAENILREDELLLSLLSESLAQCDAETRSRLLRETSRILADIFGVGTIGCLANADGPNNDASTIARCLKRVFSARRRDSDNIVVYL